jgi:hypothetical protein
MLEVLQTRVDTFGVITVEGLSAQTPRPGWAKSGRAPLWTIATAM